MPDTSHLIPFKKGYDPRRVIPNNTGKTLRPNAKKILRQLLAEGGEKINERDATRGERILYLAVVDALNEDLAPIDRHRALNIILDRTEGKPIQAVKQTGAVSLNIIGRHIADLSPEEWEQAKGLLRERRGKIVNDMLVEAEFEDVKSGEIEA